MSITPEALDAMAAAGLTAEQIIAVVKADMVAEQAKRTAAEDDRKARARESNRERQARFRERRNANNADNAVTRRDERDPSPKDNNQTPTHEISPSDPKGSSAPKGARKPRNRALPTDWQPGEKSDAVRLELGRSVRWMHDTAAAMRNWAEGRGEVRADWDAVHSGWMRREAKREGDQPGGFARAGPAKPKSGNGFFDLLHEELGAPDDRYADQDHRHLRLAAGGRH
ncbi:hypothetical protein [Methylobacterium sp. Gmos1]